MSEKKKLFDGKQLYNQLMGGISYMTPLIVAGGIIQALPNLWTGGAAGAAPEGSIAWLLYTYGNGLFGLMYYVLAMFTSFSIAGRPGIVPGLVAGYFGTNGTSTFLGACAGGFIAGYIAKWLVKNLKLPTFLASAKPILFIPLLSSLLMIFVMYYVVDPVCGFLMNLLYQGGLVIESMGIKWLLLGVFGISVCFGMGGPVCVALVPLMIAMITEGDLTVAATMNCCSRASVYGTALAVALFPKRFNKDLRSGIPGLIAGGLTQITEFEIPYFMSDMKVMGPAYIVSGFVGGAMVALMGHTTPTFHGGIFTSVLASSIPKHWLCMAIQAAVLVLWVFLFKKEVSEEEEK